MTFTTCSRCGAIARVIAGNISHLERNCTSDCYRCEGCGTVTWQDRPPRNFFGQEISKAAALGFGRGEPEPAHV